MAELTEPDTIRDEVRAKYAAAARAAASGAAAPASCCGPTEVPLTDASGAQVFGDALYDADEAAAAQHAVGASLGCGVPTAVADLHEGETVLDLGSGAGADVLISARRVGPGGRVIGLDMTDEMLELARANAAQAGVTNAEFVKGHIEDMPLPDASVDVVISNCVINLSSDKAAVLAEVARVLRPGGRFAVSDVIADPDMDDATRADMAQWTGCIAGARTREQFTEVLAAAGLVDVEVRETHRVHEFAGAAIIRARKPAHDGAGCCCTDALATCCEPAAKGDCCGEPAPAAAPARCGCTAPAA
jgi:arsenite methyltransferase